MPFNWDEWNPQSQPRQERPTATFESTATPLRVELRQLSYPELYAVSGFFDAMVAKYEPDKAPAERQQAFPAALDGSQLRISVELFDTAALVVAEASDARADAGQMEQDFIRVCWACDRLPPQEWAELVAIAGKLARPQKDVEKKGLADDGDAFAPPSDDSGSTPNTSTGAMPSPS